MIKADDILVSVIIPTYSRPDNICRAIDSVLAQTYKNIEIIVVDDNGEGTPYQLKTENVLDDYIKQGKIIYLKHEVNKNGSAARNTGFKASKGDYITFLDDDDEMYPEKIEKQVQALIEAGESVAMAYCGCQIIRNNHITRIIRASKSGNLMQEMLLGTWGIGSGSNLLIRRDAIERIGGYDESFKRRQDVEFTLRLFRFYDIVGIDEVLLTKYNDTKPHRPNARQYLALEEKFLNTFKDDICSYSSEIANQIYYHSYYLLAVLAINELDLLFAFFMMRKASFYKRISFLDIIKLLKNILFRSQRR